MKISLIVLLGKQHYKLIQKIIKENNYFDEIIFTTNISDNSVINNIKHLIKPFDKVRLLQLKTDDFSEMRNRSLKKAKNNWVFFLDADEVIDKQLQTLLKTTELNSKAAGYRIPRYDVFLGKKIKYGEVFKQRLFGITRLINKNIEGRWIGKVHEVYQTSGKVYKLSGSIIHNSHAGVKDFLHKINYYSDLRAKELAQKNISTIEIFTIPILKFIYSYFILLGFLDKAEGFIYSFMMSFHSFLSRAKAYVGKNN
ncbi:MAG: hypothetical protein KatS3mg090_0802 [Patescibacteria group bacterium]|nr:MAG: hypothetical protein KatS3mg090_0802 [Patescibacteria group bacterium]